MRFILLLAKRVGPAAILLLAACPLWAESGDASADTYVPGTIDSLSWRNIGPNRGGRSIAVSGNPNRPFEYYFGATGGGLWKTSDGGNTWWPVTDGQIQSSSVGAVAVAPSNQDVVYMGMGEVQLRGNVMQGDGVHKSVDGGRTWTHSGLPNSLAIGRIRIHPRNPDLAYAAVLGDPTGPNEDRGTRTRDGGRTCNVLYMPSTWLSIRTIPTSCTRPCGKCIGTPISSGAGGRSRGYGSRRMVSRGSWKKNGALHSVIRVSDQAATSACLRTSLRRW